VAGTFSMVDSTPAARVAKWDGAAWSTLGDGINPGLQGLAVNALAVFDAGSGDELYAGGDFFTAGGLPIQDLARWNGSTWSSIPGAPFGVVTSMLAHDDGSGPALYVTGSLALPGPVSCSVARYDGVSWTSVGNYFGATGSIVVFDDGSGPAFWASTISGSHVVRKLSGGTWIQMGQGFYGLINKMAVYDDGAGPSLYIGGEFTHTTSDEERNRIAKWSGGSWASVGTGIQTYGRVSTTAVTALQVYDDGSGPALYVGGNFRSAGGVEVNGVAKWDGAQWSAPGSGVECRADGSVKTLTAYNTGAGTRLFAGGQFTHISGKLLSNIARWDGSDWHPLAGGVGQDDGVNAMAVFDDGSGPALYIGGDFDSVSGIPASNIARWDGASWSALGAGVNSVVQALRVHDDGSGPALYVGGYFTSAGGQPARFVARWNGSSWTSPGGGMDGGEGTAYAPGVYDFGVYDDGEGARLYAAGQFSVAGGVAAHGLAMWDGTAWSALEKDGPAECVFATAVYERSGDSVLYVGGAFSMAGDTPAQRIATWGPCPGVGGPVCPVIIDQPEPQTVAAGGSAEFIAAALGKPPLSYQWLKNGEPVTDGGGVAGALTPHLTIDGVMLVDEGEYRLEVTNACGPVLSDPAVLDVTCPADLSQDGLVDFSDYLEFLNLYDSQDLAVDFNQDGQVDFLDYLEFLNHYDAGC